MTRPSGHRNFFLATAATVCHNGTMSIHEIGLWSALAGGLFTLVILTLSDLFSEQWNLGALRNAVFVLAAGGAVMMVTGLPEILFPHWDGLALRMLKASVGPLVAALTLYYLGQWMGGAREDVVMYRITTWGSRTLVLFAMCLAFATTIVPSEDFWKVLVTTAAVTLLAALLGVSLALRASALGDPLARWMAVSCGVLFFMSMGIYLKGLQIPLGMVAWIFTAVLTITFFVLTTVLVRVRNLENRRLGQWINLDPSIDPTTGLPSGASLVSKVEHTFWLTGRRHGRCTVICIHLRNLYELADTVGQGADYQILRVMAARIRRVVGFRCVVGVYHPRCFVVVLDADQYRDRLSSILSRFREFLPQAIPILGTDSRERMFAPVVGLGLVEASATQARALDTLHEAERQSQYSIPVQSEGDIVTIQ